MRYKLFLVALWRALDQIGRLIQAPLLYVEHLCNEQGKISSDRSTEQIQLVSRVETYTFTCIYTDVQFPMVGLLMHLCSKVSVSTGERRRSPNALFQFPLLIGLLIDQTALVVE